MEVALDLLVLVRLQTGVAAAVDELDAVAELLDDGALEAGADVGTCRIDVLARDVLVAVGFFPSRIISPLSILSAPKIALQSSVRPAP